jgi:hypothetical protein
MAMDNGLASFDFMHTTTSISTPNTKNTPIGIRYNLSGQRVDESYKGLVIINGRKRLIK